MRKNLVWTMLSLLSIVTFSCSGSGGNVADTMTVTISSLSGEVTTTYTEQTNSKGYLDPFLRSEAWSSGTVIYLFSGATTDPAWTNIKISMNGNMPQTFPVDIDAHNYIAYETNSESYISTLAGQGGTITLSSIGNVGAKIAGTFDAILTSVTNTFDTITISGSFSVTRDQ